jgi:hypothetical protein
VRTWRLIAAGLIVGVAAGAAIFWFGGSRIMPSSVRQADASPAPTVTVALPASPPSAPERAAAATPPAPAKTASVIPVPPPQSAVSAPAQTGRPQIARAQALLAELGYPIGVADGVAGKKTRSAVSAFRATNGLAKGDAIDDALIQSLELSARQQTAARPAGGMPAAAPRTPAASMPVSSDPPSIAARPR